MTYCRLLCSRCKSYEREGIPYVGYAHYRGFMIVRLDEIMRVSGAMAVCRPLNKAERRGIDRAIKRLDKRGDLIVAVEWSPEDGRRVLAGHWAEGLE